MVRQILEPERMIDVYAQVDVVVSGGGPAGVCAALAAARRGQKVVLVEQMGFMGGVHTASGVNGIGGWQHDLDGRPLIAGIPRELITRLAQLGGADMHVVNNVFRHRHERPTYREGGLGCYWINSNPEYMKILLDRMLVEAGVNVVLHANAVRPIMDGNRVCGLFMESKSGRQAILAKVTIDATGDGDIAARAGAAFELGRKSDGFCQPMSMIFTVGAGAAPKLCYNPWDDQLDLPPLAKNRYRAAIKKARDDGEIKYNPNDIFCAETPINYQHENICSVNFTRIQKLTPTNCDDYTKAEMIGREQVLEGLHFMQKYVIGNEEAFLVSIPPVIGTRESRRILGKAYLTCDDIRSGRKYDDVIARAIYMIDTHNPTAVGEPSHLEYLDQPYDIPYGSLVPKDVRGLLTAGRCISGDTVALSSFRILATCYSTGEAAGAAAALCAQENISPEDLDVEKLQRSLVSMGANLGIGYDK